MKQASDLYELGQQEEVIFAQVPEDGNLLRAQELFSKEKQKSSLETGVRLENVGHGVCVGGAK